MSELTVQPFGELPDGRAARRWTFGGEAGLRFSVTDYGGTITSLEAPDRQGARADVVLGYDTLAGYVAGRSYFGATVGRFGNRIARGQFLLDGRRFTLPLNEGTNHLHGGVDGFGKKLWESKAVHGPAASWLELSRLSPEGEEGYPGNLQVTVTFALLGRDTLSIRYRAETDHATPVNLTNHSFFNLAGHAAGAITSHRLTLAANRFTPVDATLIPTGEVRSVAGTPLDFQAPIRIGERIDSEDEQLQLAGGYDQNFVLEEKSGSLQRAAFVEEPGSGRCLEVLTTEPAVQFYSGNFLDGTERGRSGVLYQHRTGFCLETQHYPDAPNHAAFPNTILRPGTIFDSTTLYRFSVRES